MTSRTPTLEEVISSAIASRLLDVHVSLPGRIEKYDASQQKADIKPLIQRNFINSDDEEILESLPIIPDVPIMFPRGGGFFVSFPLQKGDNVLIIFNEAPIDKYMDGAGNDTEPDDFRRFDLSDAVAIPTFYPFGESLDDADEDNMVMGKDGDCQIHIEDSAINLGSKSPSDAVGVDSKIEAELGAIYSAISGATIVALDGGASLKSTIIAALDTHALPGSFPKPVGSSKVKTDP